MDIWEKLQKWYTQRGISTGQFFNDNSTEMGRDEMLMDFASRMLEGNFDVAASQLKHAIKQVHQDPVVSDCRHIRSTYNGQASWCLDCKSIWLVEDIAKMVQVMNEKSNVDKPEGVQ